MLKEHSEINVQKLAEFSAFLFRCNFIKSFTEKDARLSSGEKRTWNKFCGEKLQNSIFKKCSYHKLKSAHTIKKCSYYKLKSAHTANFIKCWKLTEKVFVIFGALNVIYYLWKVQTH